VIGGAVVSAEDVRSVWDLLVAERVRQEAFARVTTATSCSSPEVAWDTCARAVAEKLGAVARAIDFGQQSGWPPHRLVRLRDDLVQLGATAVACVEKVHRDMLR